MWLLAYDAERDLLAIAKFIVWFSVMGITNKHRVAHAVFFRRVAYIAF